MAGGGGVLAGVFAGRGGCPAGGGGRFWICATAAVPDGSPPPNILPIEHPASRLPTAATRARRTTEPEINNALTPVATLRVCPLQRQQDSRRAADGHARDVLHEELLDD